MDGRAPSGRGRPIGEPVGGGNEKHYRKIASGAPMKKESIGALFFLAMKGSDSNTREREGEGSPSGGRTSPERPRATDRGARGPKYEYSNLWPAESLELRAKYL